MTCVTYWTSLHISESACHEGASDNVQTNKDDCTMNSKAAYESYEEIASCLPCMSHDQYHNSHHRSFSAAF